MYNILVIGAVQTTAVTIEKLVEHQFNIVGVLGHEPKNQARVSGLSDLRSIAAKHNLDFRAFKGINHETHVNWAAEKKPDIIFAVGFSQLLHDVWLQMPKLGCIGFHPTKLPKEEVEHQLLGLPWKKKWDQRVFSSWEKVPTTDLYFRNHSLK